MRVESARLKVALKRAHPEATLSRVNDEAHEAMGREKGCKMRNEGLRRGDVLKDVREEDGIEGAVVKCMQIALTRFDGRLRREGLNDAGELDASLERLKRVLAQVDGHNTLRSWVRSGDNEGLEAAATGHENARMRRKNARGSEA